MKLPIAVALILMATFSNAGNVAIRSVFPSDPTGNAITPGLGEPFWITATFVSTNPSSVSMSVGGLGQALVSPSFGTGSGEGQATYGPLVALADGPFRVDIRIGDEATSLNIEPAMPTDSIEYYAPHLLQGGYRSELGFKAGQSSSLTWYIPSPPTFGFQKVTSVLAPNSKASAPDILQTSSLTATVSVTTVARAVRTNASLLRTVGFSSLSSIPKDVKAYLKSETLIESGDSRVKSLATSTLPKNYNRGMSIYDAAKLLFRASVKKLSYAHLDGNRPSAAQALRTGVGDCGFFSSVFVALCRQSGIPARPISGFLTGQNNWHVWAEFYIPGHGWIPVDPTYSDSLVPDGSQALYFGVVPDLNDRLATSIGFDHSFAKVKLPMFQCPMAFTDAKKVAWVSTVCESQRVDAP